MNPSVYFPVNDSRVLMPTVPPSQTFLDTIDGIVNQGLGIYKSITDIKASGKTTVTPTITASPVTIKTQEVAPAVKTDQASFIQTPNAQIIPFPVYGNQQQESKDYTAIFLIIGIAVIVLAFIKLK